MEILTSLIIHNFAPYLSSETEYRNLDRIFVFKTIRMPVLSHSIILVIDQHHYEADSTHDEGLTPNWVALRQIKE